MARPRGELARDIGDVRDEHSTNTAIRSRKWSQAPGNIEDLGEFARRLADRMRGTRLMPR